MNSQAGVRSPAGRKEGEMREYSRNPTYPDGDAYDPTYIPVTETKDKEKETEMKANTKEKEVKHERD